MDELSPEQLLAGLAAGQETAFAALYRQFGDRLYRTARTLLTRPHDAEDAVQEVFVALVRSHRQLRGVENLPAYLFAALRRAAGRIGQRRARDVVRPVDMLQLSAASGEADDAAVDQGHRRAWLRQAVARLPIEQREIIALKIDGELTFAEIAAALDINPNTAASRYRYALERLRAAAAIKVQYDE